MDISLQPASAHDRPFVERIYFETQRYLIEELFGWKGETIERASFANFYDEVDTSIVVVDREDAGWLTVQRGDDIHVESIYIAAHYQRRGIGSRLLRDLISEADAAAVTIRIETAKINPARKLYERFGFVVVSEAVIKSSCFARASSPRVVAN